MSSAKTAELIEMQFELLSQVSTDYKEHYMGCRCPHAKEHFWSVWPIEKHTILRGGGELCKKPLDRSNDLYVVIVV